MVAAQTPEPFPEQIQIATSLKRQVDGMLTGCYTDCYMEDLHGAQRELLENKDDLLHRYYLNGGLLKAQ